MKVRILAINISKQFGRIVHSFFRFIFKFKGDDNFISINHIFLLN